MEIHIVRIESIRHFDESEMSHLPLMDVIFGLYKTQDEAIKAVWQYFGNDKYEIVFNSDLPEEDQSYCDEIFKYEDKKYGGVAYYKIFYHVESIEI